MAIATLYTELDLDMTKFQAKQKKLLDDIKKVGADSETALQRSFMNLGVTSDSVYKLMAEKARVSYEQIAQSGKASAAEQVRAQQAMVSQINAINAKMAEGANAHYATLGMKSAASINEQIANVQRAATAQQLIVGRGSEDWVRIEKAKNEQLKTLNKEMTGDHEMSMASMTRAVLRFYAAWYIASAALGFIKDALMSGVNAIDEMRISAISVAALITSSQGSSGNIAENYKNNLIYAKALVPVLMQIDAASSANLSQLQKMTLAMASQRVYLDINKQKQIETMTDLSNIISVMTKNSHNQEQQFSQEVKAIFTGQIRPGIDMVASSMDQLIRQQGVYKDGLKGLLEYARNNNINPLELLAPYLVGMREATKDIEGLWSTVQSSMESTWLILQTKIFADIYDDMVKYGKDLNAWLKDADNGLYKFIERLGQTKDAIKKLIDLIPEGVGGVLSAGILGRLLFGTTPAGVFIGGLVLLYDALGRLAVTLDNLDSSKANAFFDLLGISMNKARREAEMTAAAYAVLAAQSGMFGGGASGGKGATRDFGITTPDVGGGKTGPTKEEIEAAKKAAKELADYLKKLEDESMRNLIKGAEDEIALIAKVNAFDVEENKKKYAEIDKYTKAYDEQQAKNYLSFITWREKMIKETADGLVKIEKDDIAAAAHRLTAERSLYKDLKEISGLYYEGEKAIIEDEAKQREIALINEKTSAKDAANYRIAIEAAKQNKLALLSIEEAKRSNDLFAGINAGLLEMQRNVLTFGQAGYDMFKTFATSSSNVISSVLFDKMTGQLKSFKDYWKSFTSSLLQMFADICARMLIEWALLKAGMSELSVAGLLTSGAGSAIAATNMGVTVPAAGTGTSLGTQSATYVAGAGFSAGLDTVLGGLQESVGIYLGNLASNLGTEAGAATGNAILGMSNAAFAGWTAGIGTFIMDLLQGKSFQDSAVQGITTGAGAYAGGLVGSYVWPGVGTAIGAVIGGLLGFILGDLLGVGVKEQTFTVTELVNKEINSQLFDAAKGFAALNNQATSTGENGWYLPIRNAYSASIEIVQQSFNAMVFDFTSKLPKEMQTQILNELSKTDFGALQAEASGSYGGRWGIGSAQEVLGAIATKYAAYLAEALGQAYANALGDYIVAEGAGGLIGDTSVWKVLSDRVQANVNQMFIDIAKTIKGDPTTGVAPDVAGGMAKLNDLAEVFDKISQAMDPIKEIIETNGLTDYEKAIRAVNKQFEDYGVTLQAAGIDLAKYTDFQKAWDIAISNVKDEQRVDIQQQINDLGKTQLQLNNDWIASLSESNRALGQELLDKQKIIDIDKERQGLEDQLNDLLGNSTVLERQRNALLSDEAKALFDQIQAAIKAKTIADERKTLQDQYDDLTMSSTQLLKKQRDALDESNRALFDQIQKIKSETEALAIQNQMHITAKGIQGGAQNIIDEHGLSTQQLAIRAANQWYNEQITAWIALENSMSVADYLTGITTIGRAWEIMIGDAEAAAIAAAAAITIGLQSKLLNAKAGYLEAAGDTAGAEAAREQAKQYQREIDLSKLETDVQKEFQKAIWKWEDATEKFLKFTQDMNDRNSLWAQYYSGLQGSATSGQKSLLESVGGWGDLKGFQTMRLATMNSELNTMVVGSTVWLHKMMDILTLQKEMTGAVGSAEELLTAKRNLAKELLEALGYSEQALAMGRLDELKAMDKTLQRTQLQIYAAQDLTAAIDKFQARAKQISDWMDQMARSDQAPVQSVQAWNQQYAKLKTSAMVPGAADEAISAYMNYAKEYLAFQKQYGTEGSYQAIYDAIMADMKGLGVANDAALTIAEQQLDTLKSQVQATIDMGNQEATLLRSLIHAVIYGQALPEFAEGGISTGPDSGYGARLHGTEVVISPRSDYPVTVKGGKDNVIQIEEIRKLRESIDRLAEQQGDNVFKIDLDGREIGNSMARQVPRNDDLRKSIKKAVG